MNKIFRPILLLSVLALTCCTNSGNDEPIPPPEPDPDPEPEVVDKQIPAHDFIMGSLTAFSRDVRNGKSSASGGTSSTTYYNKPLFEAKEFAATDADWWDNLIEEYIYCGLDYIVPNCRGRLPKADTDSKYEVDHGDPTRIKDLIAAIKRRGADELKIAIFDDCPASWAAARNMDLFGAYTTVLTAEHKTKLNLTDAQMCYPVDDLDDIYKYIWDYNIKLAFENFYGENVENNKYLLRFNGKPVLYLWSINGFLNINYAALGNSKPDCTGKLKAILDKIHADFKATFGEDVFISADKAFADRDSSVDKNTVESLNDWFIASEKASTRNWYSLRAFNGVNVGVAVPGFLVGDRQGDRMFFDSKNGATLTEALDYMVKYKADLLLLEGFTDMAENAAYWRSTDTKFYDYPNQRLNILRKYNSKNAYPKSMRVEAETCDYFKDNTSGNSGSQYRVGDLDVKRCTDGYDGWCVTDTEAGEWLRWVELPYRAGSSTVKLRYCSSAGASVKFKIGSTECSAILPSTAGEWREVAVATVSFDKQGWRETVLNIMTGDVDLNYFTIESADK